MKPAASAEPKAAAKPKTVATPKAAAEPKTAAKSRAPAKSAASAKPKAPARSKPVEAAPAAPAEPDILKIVLDALEDNKAEDIQAIDLRGKTSIADAMVVSSGRSNRHVSALADYVIQALKAAGVKDVRVEGVPACDWVLVDAGDIIVHVFRPEVRTFYNLEKMWSAARPDDRLAV